MKERKELCRTCPQAKPVDELVAEENRNMKVNVRDQTESSPIRVVIDCTECFERSTVNISLMGAKCSHCHSYKTITVKQRVVNDYEYV